MQPGHPVLPCHRTSWFLRKAAGSNTGGPAINPSPDETGTALAAVLLRTRKKCSLHKGEVSLQDSTFCQKYLCQKGFRMSGDIV
ncbi:hypothetical protein NHX12_032901 [Muraenolepis orangiensis]|uniref:Uncharacterized protein n=1 Tax=Muraenolepis orangiensis TaxID=630683 RepID=A0A9Q0E4I4_9TELE|nr:hypothetical protein NHX12_032901 [Muraenolepis orangiensis]